LGKSLNLELDLVDEPATIALGATIATALPENYKGWSILLQGELGAGKSTLARALLHALGYEGRVPSPTYTLVEPYQFPRGDIYHIDLYRVADVNELEFLGWTDFQAGLKLIEWPERVPFLKDEADLDVVLEYLGEGRKATIFALSDRGGMMLEKIATAVPGSVTP
jgi:tRNA threonylcarbamoyladenosine biosynthesis protein TsaE